VAIAPNRYFNDKGIAQAAANLSSLFSPVGAEGGADAANFALADERRAKMNNLGRLFEAAQDPAFDQTVFDRMGQATGQWNPANGYYGVDVSAATSRANNAADNQRMLQTNVLDNQRQAVTSLYGTVAPGEIRPAVPEDLMSVLGLPGIDQVTGAPKPLSETEWDAQQKSRLFNSGQLTDQMLLETIMGERTPVQALGEDGKPVFMSPGAAVMGGAQPAPKDNGLSMSMTMPDGTVVQMGGKPLTGEQARGVNYAATAEQMLPTLDALGSTLTSLTEKSSESIPLVGNYFQSEDYQNARVQGERFVQSVLRNESGAATPDAEIAKYNATLLPQPGDKPNTIRVKSWLRKVAVEAMKAGMTADARKAQIDAAIAAGPPPEFQPGSMATAAPANASAAPAPAAPPAAPNASTPTVTDGTIIEDDNGTRLILRNGTWEPYNG
jgi:hypothetical protein